jgi:hypothetical protein
MQTPLMLDKTRIETLSDGVFAITITLLVLKLEVPEVMHHSSNEQMLQQLLELGPQFATYVVTFLIAGGFWQIAITLGALQFEMAASQRIVADALYARVEAAPRPIALLIPDWQSLEIQAARDALRSVMAAVGSAVESAVPLTPKNCEERYKLVLSFSTDPKGLGLSEGRFQGMSPLRYPGWRRKAD